MTRQACYAGIAIALIGLTGLLVITLDVRIGHTALRASLETIPTRWASWDSAPPPTGSAFTPDVNTSVHLSRGYADGVTTMWVAVDYYPQQPEGRRPAARELLFPRGGWTELQEQRITIPLAEGSPLEATQVVMRAGTARTLVVYWYQIGAHAIASDHGYRAALVYHRLLHRRADGALVRVGMPLGADDDVSRALARGREFIREFHPRLLAVLPA